MRGCARALLLGGLGLCRQVLSAGLQVAGRVCGAGWVEGWQLRHCRACWVGVVDQALAARSREVCERWRYPAPSSSDQEA